MRACRTAGLALAAVWPAVTIAADPFGDRVMAATAMEMSAPGQAYLARFMAAMDRPTTDAVHGCFPGPGAAHFTLVADVLADGRIANAEVRPAGPGPDCYRRRLEQAHAPALPQGYGESFPIVIETTLLADAPR